MSILAIINGHLTISGLSVSETETDYRTIILLLAAIAMCT